VAGILATSTLTAILQAVHVKADASTPGLTAAGTFLVDAAVVLVSVLVASATVRARPWHFGFRPAPLGHAAKITGLGVLAFYMFAIVYTQIAKPDNPQRVVQDLGADNGPVLLVAAGLVVIVVAPVCEELFFRGFLFRVLRLRMPFWVAAGIDGILFGAIHGISAITIILVVLGVILCWVYESSGTLYAPIAIHVLNNTLAYGSTADNAWGVALPIGAAMLAACTFGIARKPKPAIAPA
jgi:membrane protease YdiL (CAAX protease family)